MPPPRTPLSDACIVLVRTQGPINLGMVARLCGNLGVADLRLVAPLCEVDCSDSRKFSTHSRELLLSAPIFATVGEAVADCGLVIGTSGDFRTSELGAHVRVQDVPRLLASRPAAKYALVFGNEADGLDELELRACQAWIHLDTYGPNISYNLANAVAITGYLIASGAEIPPSDQPLAAAREHVDSLHRYWLETLERFDYFRRTERERFAPLLGKFIGRLHLSDHDVQVLRGMLAQFNVSAFKDRFDRMPPGAADERAPLP
ncbi:MAG: hypothetical protein H0W83_11110 [Planctomycetes bacterium]|nr:hypothetical protein [Planctomycetota bacterium]